MSHLKGSCYCQEIQIQVFLTENPEQIRPRKCDCSFCTKHGAAYVSDPKGSVSYHVKNKKSLKRFRQTSTDSAEFLICEECGVLVGVIYQDSAGNLLSAVNHTVMENCDFAEPMIVSPRLLSKDDKISRWKQFWFMSVALNLGVS